MTALEPVAWALVGPGVRPDDDGRLPAYVSREAAAKHAGGDVVIKPLYGDPPGPSPARVSPVAAADLPDELTTTRPRMGHAGRDLGYARPPAGGYDVERAAQDALARYGRGANSPP